MTTKADLIKELDAAKVLGGSLKKAFEKVDRADFVLPGHQALAYQNYPLPIGFGQTISQPFTVAFMLEQLKVKAGEKILEIGAGSGWQTALLAFLAGKSGKVIAVERIPELTQMAQNNLQKYPQLQSVALVITSDGGKGLKSEAPFDKIIAAAAAKEIPKAWHDQLKIGGRIVAPVNGSVVVMDKISASEYQITEHPGFVFVPLVEN